MKAMWKKIGLALAIGVLSCVCLVGCGAISMDDIKGDWTTDTMNGKSVEDFAAENGLAVGMVISNWTIKDDKTLISENVTGTLEFDMELKANGFELKQKGQSDIYCSVLFDKDKGTLSFDTKDANGGTVKCVMKKGKGEIQSGEAAASDEGSSDEGSSDAEATDDTESTEEASEDESTGEEESDDASEEGDEEESDEGAEEEEE